MAIHCSGAQPFGRSQIADQHDPVVQIPRNQRLPAFIRAGDDEPRLWIIHPRKRLSEQMRSLARV